MKAVIQRVQRAEVCINGTHKRAIGAGLVVLLGVSNTDSADICPKLAQKIAGLRIFSDADDKLNLSAETLGYEVMVVSNFTLYADTKKGKRPGFEKAAKPPQSVELYEQFVECMRQTGVKSVVTGEFGADMQISLVNDGPITIVIETDEWKNGKEQPNAAYSS